MLPGQSKMKPCDWGTRYGSLGWVPYKAMPDGRSYCNRGHLLNGPRPSKDCVK